MQDLLAESVHDIFVSLSTPFHVRRSAQRMDAALWQQLAGTGYDQALVPESLGGAGLAPSDLGNVLVMLGQFAVPAPLGEAMLARGVAALAGHVLPPGAVSAAHGLASGSDKIFAPAVPWGQDASMVLVGMGDECLLFPAVAALTSDVHAGFHPCGETDMCWSLDSASLRFPAPARLDWFVIGAALRVAQIAGALEAALALVLRYASEREQFGRPLTRFQAIQQQIAVLAEDVFAARMAAAMALRPSADVWLCRQRIAAAKVVAGEAATRGAAISHAVLGAMGVTEEHDLQLFTRRLQAWRMQHGSEAWWSDLLGQVVLDSGSTPWMCAQAMGAGVDG